MKKNFGRPISGLLILISLLAFVFNLLAYNLYAFSNSEDASSWSIDNNILKITVDKKTGAISGIWNMQTQQRYVEATSDRYQIIGKTIKKSSDESADIVTEKSLFEDKSYAKLVLKCKNVDLAKYGISLTKVYTLTNNNIATKQVEFANKGNDGLFVNWSSNVSLDGAFRKDGYYYNNAGTRAKENRFRHFGGVFVPAEWVTKTQLQEDFLEMCDNRMVVFVNGDWGIGNYRYRVNGNLALPIVLHDGTTLCYTPEGWKFRVYKDYLPPGGSSSAEVRYMLFRGCPSNFLQEYMLQPEIKSLGDYRIPAWVKNLKLNWWLFYSGDLNNSQYCKYFEEACKRLGNYPSIIHINPNSSYGAGYEWFAEEWLEDPSTARGTAAEVEKIKQRFPNVKVSFYDFLWTMWPGSKAHSIHRDWGIGNKDGSLQDDPSLGLWKQIKINECQQYYLNLISNKLRLIPLDVYYQDGGAIAPECEDWVHKCVSQWWDWYTFLNKVRQEVKKGDKDKLFFQNITPPLPGDVGFFEIGADKYTGPWTIGQDNPEHLISHDWRFLSDMLYTPKLWQSIINPDLRLVPLYWGDGIAERNYINYLLAFGFTPNLSREHIFLNPQIFERRAPYIDAAFEVRDALLTDADISPWWYKEDTEIEAYALKQGSTCLIPVINHYADNISTSISVDSHKLGLDLNKPIFIWTLQLVYPNYNPNISAKITSSIMDRENFRTVERVGEKIVLSAVLKPSLLKEFAISQVPAFVYSVNDIPTQMRLSNTLNIEISGGIDVPKNRIDLKITSPEEKCKILIVYPWKDKLPLVNIDGAETTFEIRQECGQDFLNVNVAKGRHSIEVVPR